MFINENLKVLEQSLGTYPHYSYARNIFIKLKEKEEKRKRCVNKSMSYYTYASRNKPASLRHFTLVVLGNKFLYSSQCKMAARPPAEHPERRA